MQACEVVIVGAGPIGLEIAVALKRAGVELIHLEAKQIGYTISWFAPQTRFFSSNERIAIAGVPLVTPDQSKATREEYLAYLRAVVQQFDLKVNTYEPVVGISPEDGEFILRTAPAGGSRAYRCRKLILATGGTDRPRRLNVPGEHLPHVSHYFQDPHTYFGRRLMIVGGKNSAIEAALRSHHAGAHVSISYRRENLPDKHIKYWLIPEMRGLTDAGRIEAYFRSTPVAITSTHVTLRRGGSDNGETFDVPADFVLALIGYEQDNMLFKMAGLKLSDECGAPIFDSRTMETSVPGIYVAGTAVGGTQAKFSVFIENCHVHTDRILAAITNTPVPQHAVPIEHLEMPES
jgi:thioredoxin reductase (NADPH)